MALYFALSDAFIGRPSHWVGLRNFLHLWDSDAFRQTFQNAFVFTGTAVACKLVLGIPLALLLIQKLGSRRPFRAAGLRPGVIPPPRSTPGGPGWFISFYAVVTWPGIALG